MTTVLDRPEAGTVRSHHRERGISLARLTWVELRKLADTRAGLWLLLIIGLCGVGTAAIMLLATEKEALTFQSLFSFALAPVGILLPILGILSMTSEWTQRTALATFTLVPSRGRVVAAKLLAVVGIAVAATVAAAALSALANLVAIGIDGDGSWELGAGLAGRIVLNQVMFALMGSAFGALLMNSPLAIVAYLALPMLWSVLGTVVSSLEKAAAWLDINTTAAVLSVPETVTSGQWARLGVSAAVWVLLPLVLGTVRTLRREVN
jgi:ABC-2 type transport system permease protein